MYLVLNKQLQLLHIYLTCEKVYKIFKYKKIKAIDNA